MNKFKTIFLLTILIILCPLIVKGIDLGFSKTDSAAKTAGYGATTETTLAENVGIIIKAALSFVGVIFLVLMVYAGYLWFTSRGEEEPIKKAQKIIATSVVGLAIVASAYGVTNLIVPRILERTTGEGGGAPTVGGAGVECCTVCGGTWATDCPRQQLNEAECKQLEGGEYLGLVPVEKCK